jgi:hypothetical protein
LLISFYFEFKFINDFYSFEKKVKPGSIKVRENRGLRSYSKKKSPSSINSYKNSNGKYIRIKYLNEEETKREILALAEEGDNYIISAFVNKIPLQWFDKGYPNNITPLMKAIEGGHYLLIKRLISYGADLNAVSNDNKNIFDYLNSGFSNGKIDKESYDKILDYIKIKNNKID